MDSGLGAVVEELEDLLGEMGVCERVFGSDGLWRISWRLLALWLLGSCFSFFPCAAVGFLLELAREIRVSVTPPVAVP